MNQQQKANNYEIELKSKLYEAQKVLATKAGFLQYYYNIVGKCDTQETAYNIVSNMYYLLFNEFMFKSFNSFRMYRNRNLKNT